MRRGQPHQGSHRPSRLRSTSPWLRYYRRIVMLRLRAQLLARRLRCDEPRECAEVNTAERCKQNSIRPPIMLPFCSALPAVAPSRIKMKFVYHFRIPHTNTTFLEPADLRSAHGSDLQKPNPKLQYRNPVFLNTTIGIVHANPWELYTPKLNPA